MSRLFIGLIVVSLSCQTKPKRETATTSTTAAADDSAAILAKRPGPDAPRSAADRLVRALYFEHSRKENPLLEKSDRALIDQFYIKSTADLIWSNAQKSSNQLKGPKNPLFNAPDKNIKKAWVLPAAVAGSRAVVYVTFENNNKPEEIRLDLQQIATRWRIVDMIYPDGKRLTEVLDK